MAPYTWDLFISFAPEDGPWVEGYLLPALNLPRDRWISRDLLELGAPQVAEFERVVTQSRYTLLVLSPAYKADHWTAFAQQLVSHLSISQDQVRVLPLLLKPCSLPLPVDFRVTLDCTDESRRSLQLARLRDMLGRPAPSGQDIPCPYPGMRPFSGKESHVFYGRQKEIDELAGKLRHQRYLYVIGPSGSGKSSLVSAGLLPRIKDRLVRTVRPGTDPAAALAREIDGVPPVQALLLVIDPFEEVFTLAGKEQRGEFFAALLRLRQQPARALLIGMRADFYPDLMNSALWPVDPPARVEIAPLRGEALREAIRRPAQEQGVHLEAGLLERLMQDAAEEPGVLPLLQETMVLLWEKREHRLLSLRAYEELGSGGQSGLAVALARKADGALAELPPEQKAVAWRILVRLVQFGEGRTDTRRQQPEPALRAAGDDPGLFEATLRHLAENRLLTLSGEEDRQGGRKVDLSHEALISGWPQLQAWLQERRQAEHVRRQLEMQAANWVALKREGGLLDEVELGVAQRWLAGEGSRELGPSPDLLDLVQASAAALEQARRRADEARQRELEQARRLAEAEHERADLEARRAREQAMAGRRLRRRFWVAAGLALAAVASAGAAYRSYRQSQHRLGESHMEQGRAFLLQGHPAWAMAYLNQAYQEEGSGADASLRFLLARAGREALAHRRVLRGRNGVRSAAFSPDGSRVVTDDDRNAVIWDVHGGKPLVTLEGHADTVWSAAFSPDGSRVVTASKDRTAGLWDAHNGKQLATLEGCSDSVWPAAFSPDGNRVVTASGVGSAQLWDAHNGKLIATLEEHADIVYSTGFSPDGSRLVTGSYDGTAQIWDTHDGKPLATLPGPSGRVQSAAFSSDGGRVITASFGGTAQIWDARNGKPLATLEGHALVVTSAAFSPDGSRLVTASADTTARLWDAHSGKPLATLEGHTDSVNSAAFNPDGSQLVTASSDKTVRLWDARSGKPLATLEGHSAVVWSAAFSPDGNQIVTAGADDTARLWNAHGSKLIATLPGYSIPVPSEEFSPGDLGRSAAFSPDGNQVVIASLDKTARIWDVRSGRLLVTLEGHTDSVNAAAFSPDGNEVVTASSDGTARIWEADRGKLLATLQGHSFIVRSAAFSPDGSRVVTAGQDGTARIWDTHLEMRSPKEIDTLTRCRNPFRLEDERLLPSPPDPAGCPPALFDPDDSQGRQP